MSRPISITASVAGLIIITAQVARKPGDTEDNVQIQAAMKDLNRILCRVRFFLADTTSSNRARFSIIHVHHLLVTLSACVLLCSNLTTNLDVVSRHSDSKERVKEVNAAEILEDLKLYKSSLTLILKIMQYNNPSDASVLNNTLWNILESDHVISIQLRGLIKRQQERDLLDPPVDDPIATEQNSPVVGTPSSNSPSVDFVFPSNLPILRTSATSFLLTEVSALDLPVHLSDLFNPSVYEEAMNDTNPFWNLGRLIWSLIKWDSCGRLHNATKRADISTVRLLLNLGATVDELDANGCTALLLAATLGKCDICELLLERGAQVNFTDSRNRTAISYAAARGDKHIVRRLLAEGHHVDVNKKDTQDGKTPLCWAAAKGRKGVVGHLLAREDVDINARDNAGKSALSLAAEKGHEGVVRLLFTRKDVDVNSKSDSGQTPLSLAAENGQERAVRLLLTHDDLDINAKSNSGLTPLSWATGIGHEGVVRILVTREEVDMNERSNSGLTALAIAARNSREGVVRILLLRTDVDVNLQDNHGLTPLSWATANCNASEDNIHQNTVIVKLLVAHGGYIVYPRGRVDIRNP